MIIGGDDIEEGIKNWVREEIKSGPSREYDLGKFLFSVSTGTMGIIFLAEKIDSNPAWTPSLIISFFMLVIAAGYSLYMVVPKKWEIRESDDLQDIRNGIIKRTVRGAWVWFLLWCLGFVFGLYAVVF